MRILILGGTRFLGRAVAEALLPGNRVVVLSRNPSVPEGVEHVQAERRVGLEDLSGETFDLAVDFIAYDASGPRELFREIVCGTYLLISSTWLCRLAGMDRADQPVPRDRSVWLGWPVLPGVTRDYLAGKAAAEWLTLDRTELGQGAAILRLPILWDDGEHTGRLAFYQHRLADGAPVLMVEGGGNQAQIAQMSQVCLALAPWITSGAISRSPIWEGLPGEGETVRCLVDSLDGPPEGRGKRVDVSRDELEAGFPAFLQREPLWRESPLTVTEHNIFTGTGLAHSPPSIWLPRLARQPLPPAQAGWRQEERAFIERRRGS